MKNGPNVTGVKWIHDNSYLVIDTLFFSENHTEKLQIRTATFWTCTVLYTYLLLTTYRWGIHNRILTEVSSEIRMNGIILYNSSYEIEKNIVIENKFNF